MRLTIHQPEHLPWLGFFHKISLADTYVVLDNVKYRQQYFHNRNKIRTKDGWQWITAPVEKHNDDTPIRDVKLFKDGLKQTKKNLRIIQEGYQRASFFRYYWDRFAAIYGRDYDFLWDLNLDLIKFFLEALSLKVQITLASSLGVTGMKSDLNLNICKALGASTYISGISGKDYLKIDDFTHEHINVVFQEYHHPVYKQLYEPFIPYMSILDLLFNYGDKSLDIIKGINVPVLQEVLP